jgi:hypothetical protein
MKVTITRKQTGEDGTFGILNVEDRFVCVTLEPPWKDNQRNVSCIPTGEYEVKPFISRRYGKTYKIMNVPNRTGILFHRGNYVKDTKGCILLGIFRAIHENKEGVFSSIRAFDYFSQTIRRHSFKLIIKEDY